MIYPRAHHKRGIALLVTVIFMSVMLSFGIALAALSYKQAVLASTAIQSQAAFYAADGALECALYADQQVGAYIYGEYNSTNLPNAVTLAQYAADACNGTVYGTPSVCWNSSSGGCAGALKLREFISYNQGKTCAEITIYKFGSALSSGERDFIFSTGYNVSCSAIGKDGRVVSRGIYEKY